MSGEERRGRDTEGILALLDRLMASGSMDVAGAMRELGISKGSANRYLNQLAERLTAVKRDTSSRSYTYRFDPSELPGVDTNGEPVTLAGAVAVSLASALSRMFSGSQYQANLHQLRERLIRQLPILRQAQFEHSSRKFAVIGGFEEALADRGPLLDIVLQAILQSRQLQITYDKFGDGSQSTETRLIDPYTLAVYDAHFYVVGVGSGESANRLRTFRFSRIVDAELFDTAFTYPSHTEYDPEVAFRDSIGIWGNSIEPITIKVRLAPRWRLTAQHHRWHSSQRMDPVVAPEVELTFLVRPCPEFEQWILRFGEDAEVLEPAWFRKKIGERLHRASQVYAVEKSDGH